MTLTGEQNSATSLVLYTVADGLVPAELVRKINFAGLVRRAWTS